MEKRMNKQELQEWLQAHDVEVPASATIRHLRALYDSHPANCAANEEENDEEENNEEEDNEEEDNAEEALDEEIRILQKKKKIADLRRELAGNELLFVRPPQFQDLK